MWTPRCVTGAHTHGFRDPVRGLRHVDGQVLTTAHAHEADPCLSCHALQCFHTITEHVFVLLHSNPSSNTDNGQKRIVWHIWTCAYRRGYSAQLCGLSSRASGCSLAIIRRGYSPRLCGLPSRAPGCSSTSAEYPATSGIGSSSCRSDIWRWQIFFL